MSRSLKVVSGTRRGHPVGELPAQPDIEEFTMDISVDTKSDLVTGITDVRHTPLGRLARQTEGAGAGSLHRVLSGAAVQRVAVAAFNSSI
jgi:FXSXX-COOH protein